MYSLLIEHLNFYTEFMIEPAQNKHFTYRWIRVFFNTSRSSISIYSIVLDFSHFRKYLWKSRKEHALLHP